MSKTSKIERTKKNLVALLCLIMAASFLSTPVFAEEEGSAFVMPEILILSAPEKQQRRFDIDGPFDLWLLSNIATSFVICIGEADDLTITMSFHSSLSSKDHLDFTAIAAGISTSAAIFGMDSITTPYSITLSLNIKSNFAALALLTIVTNISDSMSEPSFPLEFTVEYDLTQTPPTVVPYSIWCDDETDLCWQDPQKDYHLPGWDYDNLTGYYGLTGTDANRYCKEMVLGGYDDWRAPTINEIRTIIRGNPSSETGGDCPVVSGTGRTESADEACLEGEHFSGPGAGGCYWMDGLTGNCNRNDPASVGHPLEYVTSDIATDDDKWIGFVAFESGRVGFNHLDSLTEVRCVRDDDGTEASTCEDAATCEPGEARHCNCSLFKSGAQTCNDEGSCFGPCECTGFVPTLQRVDVCPTCDQITVTVTVPEKLSHEPGQIVAFFYHPDNFPPLGPPDGGTSDQQIMDPDIDVDNPLTVIIPACSYYRDECLKGEYHLYVSLLKGSGMPIPMPGDYIWGPGKDPLTLGGGDQNLTIELELVE